MVDRCRTRSASIRSRTDGFSIVTTPSSASSPRQAGDEAVQVGRVRHHVVGDDHVGVPAVGRSRRRAPRRRTRAPSARRPRSAAVGLVRRRVDAEHRDARARRSAGAGSRRCEPSSTTRLSGPRPRSSMSRVACVARVREERVGERREVQVVVDEQLLRRHLLEDLHQRAVEAERDLERVARLGPVEVLLAHERVGERQVAEREEHLEPPAAAQAAAQRQARARDGLAPAQALVEAALVLQRAHAADALEPRAFELLERQPVRLERVAQLLDPVRAPSSAARMPAASRRACRS